eukprot:05857_4
MSYETMSVASSTSHATTGLLSIEPEELVFSGSSLAQGKTALEKMRIFNPTANTITFKIKTTAPRRYCVRPNNGILPPKGQLEVQVSLQTDADIAETKKDKFLVESFTVVDNPTPELLQQMWSITPAESISKQKFRCRVDDISQSLYRSVSDVASETKSTVSFESAASKLSVRPTQPTQPTPASSPAPTSQSTATVPKGILADGRLSDVDLRKAKAEVDEKSDKQARLSASIRDVETKIS